MCKAFENKVNATKSNEDIFFMLIGLISIFVQSIEDIKKREPQAPFFYCTKDLELNI